MKNTELTDAANEVSGKQTPNSDSPQTTEHEALTTIRGGAKFGLSVVVATPAALELMRDHTVNPNALLARHASGDWGDVGSDAKLNEMAVADGSRIFSVYRLAAPEQLAEVPHSQRHELPTVWIITNAANAADVRDVTTILTPDCF